MHPKILIQKKNLDQVFLFDNTENMLLAVENWWGI